jgi:hypothetical protein
MLTTRLAAAPASRLNPVHGSLADNAGRAVSGAQPATFRLYADGAATSPLWTEVSGLVFDAQTATTPAW